MKPTLLTEGPLTAQLLRLAGPVFVSRALHTLYGVAATAWVGRLGPEALAAVSTGFFASWTIGALGDVLVAGVTALVSQAIGARREKEASEVARVSLWIAVLLGTVVAGIWWVASPILFRALFDDPEIVRLGTRYLSLYGLLSPIFFLVFAFESIFRSCGNTRIPMLVLGAGSIVNLILDPLLILGVGPFPRWGVEGAVLATAISESLVLLCYVVLALRNRLPLAIRFLAPPSVLDRPRVASIFSIGTPQAVTGFLFAGIYLYLSRLVGKFGAEPLAALGVINRLESLNYLTSVAMGMAVAAMVGQNLGAGRDDRAELAAHRGAALITIVTLAMTAIFLLFPMPILRLFTPQATEAGAGYLRIIAISQVFMGWEIVYASAFAGAGHTLPPMNISIATSVVRPPLASYLSAPGLLGAAGVWWTLSVTCVLRGLWIVIWFRRGSWKVKGLRRVAQLQPSDPSTEGAT